MRDQQRALASPLEQRVSRHCRAHLDDPDRALWNRLTFMEAEKAADSLDRRVLVGRALRQEFSRMQMSGRVTADHVGEGAAAIDPEVPGVVRDQIPVLSVSDAAAPPTQTALDTRLPSGRRMGGGGCGGGRAALSASPLPRSIAGTASPDRSPPPQAYSIRRSSSSTRSARFPFFWKAGRTSAAAFLSFETVSRTARWASASSPLDRRLGSHEQHMNNSFRTM